MTLRGRASCNSSCIWPIDSSLESITSEVCTAMSFTEESFDEYLDDTLGKVDWDDMEW